MSVSSTRRRKAPEPFDVGDFLRENDSDLKSALNSLLRETPDANPIPGVEESPDLKLREDLKLRPGVALGPGINLEPDIAPVKGRTYPVRRMHAAEEAHTRAEQFVYDYLWNHAEPLDEISRKVTIGLGALAKAVRLSESNARINTRSLAAKLALEEYEAYNCEQSIGRTYRVFSLPEIMRRRTEAGLVWYMRRTLAVIFVDQAGIPLQLKTRS